MTKYLVIAISFLMVACNAGKNRTNIELVQDMFDQISLKSQDADPLRDGEASNRVPPENTVPRGYKPMPYKDNPTAAGRNLKNPLNGEFGVEVIELGKQKYDIYCGICHGAGGAGDGSVAEKMAVRPPSLLTPKVRNHPDGRLYHIITAGQGVMGSYASQITDQKARWAIVNYIRNLQRSSK